MKYYNPFSIENLIIYLDDLSIFKYNKLKPFLINRYATILFYFGIKGSGKTTQLLYASLELHHPCEMEIPRLYIDCHLMKKKHKIRKLIFKKELFYLFQNKEELLKFMELGNYKQIKEYENFLIFLYKFLESFFELNYFKDKILLILDNLNDENDTLEDCKEINKIIVYVKKIQIKSN